MFLCFGQLLRGVRVVCIAFCLRSNCEIRQESVFCVSYRHAENLVAFLEKFQSVF